MIVGGQSRGWVKAMFHFARLVSRIRKNQGSRGLAIFLKANQLIIQRVISGSKLVSTRLAGSAVSVTNTGIPRWIPVNHRKLLLKGSRSVITFYLVLCTLYRVMDYKGKLSLSTITDIGKPLESFLPEWKTFVKKAFLPRLGLLGVNPVPVSGSRKKGPSTPVGVSNDPRIFGSLAPIIHWNFKSGPNSFITKLLSIGNAWVDLLALIERPDLLARIEALRAMTGGGLLRSLPFFDDACRHLDKWWDKVKFARRMKKKELAPLPALPPQFEVGKLGVVEEPGKKRIVAMVDVWTQWMFYPLHRFFFDKVLFFIKQDGTFDQVKPVDRLLEKAEKEGRKHFWSFDLSAATDRLPLVIQTVLLGAFVSERYATLWSQVLTDRPYRTPKEYSTTFGRKANVGHVTYKVGQPMGAYSSWAMLAITHHAIVQFAAWRVGHRTWFSWYAVLGDDVVICDRDVANMYVKVMDELGVKIGFHKSIISDNSSLEFAKRFYYKGKLVSGLSLGGIAVGWLGPGFIPELVSTVQSKLNVTLSLYSISRFMGVGYKAASAAATRQVLKLPKSLRSAIVLLSRPGAPLGVSSLLDWYTLTSVKGPPANLGSDAKDVLFESLRTEIVDKIFVPTIKRSRIVLDGFLGFTDKKGKRRGYVFDTIFNAHPTTYLTWFKVNLIGHFRDRYDETENQAGLCLENARKVWYATFDFSKSVRLLEKALAYLALTPTSLSLHRAETKEVPLTSKDLDMVLIPRSVKRWNANSDLSDRKTKPHYVPRMYIQSKDGSVETVYLP